MNSPDIPAVLDKLLVIYAPVAFKLMKEFPEAFGASFFLRNDDDYAAIPNADVPPGYADGYGDEAFETLASDLLKAVRPATEALRDSFGLIDDVRNFGIYLTKDKTEGSYRLRASISSPVLYHSFYRDAYFKPGDPTFFSGMPATMTMMASGENLAHAKLLVEAAEKGIDAVAEVIASNEIMLDFPKDGGSFRKVVATWNDKFPAEGPVTVEKIQHIHEFFLESPYSNALVITAEDDPRNDMIRGLPQIELVHFDQSCWNAIIQPSTNM